MLLADARQPRAERADAADVQPDPHAGLRRRVERRDDLLVDERVHLGDDLGRLASLGAAAVPGRSAATMRRRRSVGAITSFFSRGGSE